MKRVFLTEAEALEFARSVEHLCIDAPVVAVAQKRFTGAVWRSSVWEVRFERADQLQLVGIEPEEVTHGHA